MNIGVYTRLLQNVSRPVNVQPFEVLDDALAWADIVSLHIPLNASTNNLIDENRLAAMKSDALLINTARGGLLDTNAAVRALKAGKLGGLGLDVFPEEPLPATNLLIAGLRNGEDWANGRVIITPHVGGASPEALEDLRRRSVETARDFLKGGTIRNRVA
jgi:phosphoglycerate dehydrogenase-like enzyme